MCRSTLKRGLILISFFIFYFIVQSFAAFHSSNCKQFQNQNNCSEYLPFKNITDFNLSTSFFEEETEDDNDSESFSTDLYFSHSHFQLDSFKNPNQNKFKSKISFLKNTPLYINIHNFRI